MKVGVVSSNKAYQKLQSKVREWGKRGDKHKRDNYEANGKCQ